MGSFILFMLFLAFIYLVPKYIDFKGSKYYEASGNGFLKTIQDKGLYGEYLSFLYLEKLNGYKKIMSNLYIPKSDGTTTEIDLIFLHPTGIYVIESKNYGGWIFGNEKNNNWTQTFKNSKIQFYNPIWQNKGHIKALKDLLGIHNDNIFKSYIVFSERCTLKKIDVTATDVKVIKRNTLVKTIKEDIQNSSNVLSVTEIHKLYSILQNYIKVDEAVKIAHVQRRVN